MDACLDAWVQSSTNPHPGRSAPGPFNDTQHPNTYRSYQCDFGQLLGAAQEVGVNQLMHRGSWRDIKWKCRLAGVLGVLSWYHANQLT